MSGMANDRFAHLSRLDTIISLVAWTAKAIGFVSAVVLPAWAVKATHFMGQYAPLSWVVAGFAGGLLAVVGYAIYAAARERLIRAYYDRRMISRGAYVDPMKATFERQRIYLNDFALPSNPFIEDKTFIDCELIGPTNLFMGPGNQHTDQRLPRCDAVLIRDDGTFYNGVTFVRCTFRRCSFQRITIFVPLSSYMRGDKDVNWLNYITFGQDQGDLALGALNLTPQIAPQLPKEQEAAQEHSGDNDVAK